MRRWCIRALVGSLGFLVIGVLLPSSIDTPWAVGWVSLWTLASVTYGSTRLVEAGHWARSNLAARRSAANARSRPPISRRTLKHLGSSQASWLRGLGRILLPVLLLAGPLLFATQWLPAEIFAYGVMLALGLGLALWVLPHACELVGSVRQAIALPDFVASVLVWELCGAVLAVQMGWPAPRQDVFELLAQINVALFVAVAIVFDVPPAWRPVALTYYAGGLLVMTIGLLAAIAGAVEVGDRHVLFVLSLGPVLPAVTAYLIKAHTTLGGAERRRRD